MMARSIWLLAIKDLRLLLRQRGALFFVVVFPVLFGVLFGLIFSSTATDSPRLDVAIVDLDNSTASRDFIDALEDKQGLRARTLDAPENAAALVRKREIVASIVIEPGFSRGLGGLLRGEPALRIAGVTDPARTAEVRMLRGILTETAFAFLARTADAPTLPDPASFVDIELEHVETDGGVGTQNAFEITFPQAAAWALVGCITTFGVSAASERSRGTLQRLLTMPVGTTEIVASKALACFVASFAVLAALYAVGWIAFGVRIPRPLVLLGVLAVIAYAFVGLMVMLAAVARSENVADGFIRGVLLVLALTGGAGVPLAFIQGWMRTLSAISPFSWAILAIEGATFRGFTPAELAAPLVVLVGVGTLGLAVGTALAARTMRTG